MPFESLDKLSFVDIPQLDGGISAAGNQVSRIAGKLAIPHPPEMSLQHFVLEQLKLVAIRYYFVQLDLLISRARRHELIVGRYLAFEYIVLMGLNLFVSNKMFPKGLHPAFTVCEYDVFTILTHRDGADTDLVFAEDTDLLLLGDVVPDSEIAGLVTG